MDAQYPIERQSPSKFKLRHYFKFTDFLTGMDAEEENRLAEKHQPVMNGSEQLYPPRSTETLEDTSPDSKTFVARRCPSLWEREGAPRVRAKFAHPLRRWCDSYQARRWRAVGRSTRKSRPGSGGGS
jgi:hypothetical protein